MKKSTLMIAAIVAAVMVAVAVLPSPLALGVWAVSVGALAAVMKF